MIRKILLASSIVSLMACNNSSKMEKSTTGTPAGTPAGWVSLFDGKTLNGWHKYGGGPAPKSWTVTNGTIFLDPAHRSEGGGDIVTDKEYTNFHLKYDWKIDTGGNSGLIFFIKEDAATYDATYYTGPEMQILDNERHEDAKIYKHRAGDLYDLVASASEPVKPALEWNHAEIMALNGKLELWLNGTKVVSTTMWDDQWNKLVAGSKFKSMPGFAKFKTGRIGLQDHGNGVWFKDIMIQEL